MSFKLNDSKYVPLILGTAAGIVLYLIFAALFALMFYYFDIDRKYLPFFSTLALSLACFTSSYFAARRAGGKGYAIGGTIGIICFAAVTAVAVFVSSGRFTLNTLFHFVLIVLSSTVGGILGVNGKSGKII